MSEQDGSRIDLNGLTERLKRDIGSGARTAKVVWKATVAPGLRDIGQRVRDGGGRATGQAGDVFTGLGRRLRGFGDRLKNR